MEFSTLISSVGVTIILLAFLLSVLKILSIESKWYFILNIVGGGFACYGSILIDSLPFTILEGTWCFIAFMALFKSIKKR